MDIGISNIVPVITQATTDYLAEYAPLFLLMAGLLLAFGIIFKLLGFIPGSGRDGFEQDERRERGDWI